MFLSSFQFINNEDSDTFHNEDGGCIVDKRARKQNAAMTEVPWCQVVHILVHCLCHSERRHCG